MTQSTGQGATPTARHGRRAIALACGLALALLAPAAADARLGDLDPAFGGDGIAAPDVGAAADARLAAVVSRPDGRPVAAGWAGNGQQLDEAVVVQLTDSGAPDAGFGAGTGFLRLTGQQSATRFLGVALDSAGRVLAVGSRVSTFTAPLILRSTAGGTPDPTLANPLSLQTGEAHAVIPLANGNLLVGGWRSVPGAAPREAFFVARMDDEGTLDETFGGGDGIADVLFGDAARARAMAVGPDGSIVLAGWALDQNGLRRPALGRVDSAGSPDPNFGVNGGLLLADANPNGSSSGELRAVAVDAVGRITVAGESPPFGLVARRLASGAADPGFGAGGSLYNASNVTAALNGLALDGARALVAGATGPLRSPTELLLGSLDGSGTPEPGAGGSPPGWRVFASPLAGGIGALGAALAPGGALYTAGALGSPAQPYVSRHLPNAAPAAALAAPAQVQAGAPATFDAAGSSDPEGEQLSFAFDLDGDGSYEFDGGGNPLALRSFSAAGSYTVGVRVTDPRGASATATRAIAVTAAPGPPPPQPVLGGQGVAKPLRGIVRYRLPGTKKFVPLVELTAIPNGTEIDARKGRLLITVLHDASGRLDGARFYAGRFIFRQGKGDTPITTLKLTGGSFKNCTRKAKASAFIASVADGTGTRSSRRVRKLWGSGRGRFRTRGRYGAATVRGTKWLTLDRCDGTKVRVVRGKVGVLDLVHPNRRQKIVTAGRKTFVPYKRAA